MRFNITFGPFRLDRANHRLLRGVDVVALRPKAFAVLDHLAARPGLLVTKEQLLAAVWPGTAVTDTVLKVCVREIREALDDDPESPRYIETAHRLGYRFIGQMLPTNLPAPVSALIGREHELQDIARALDESRLVTLVGAGGAGKSRLALEAAGTLRERFEDGIWWVDLAPLTDETFVPQAAAVALGVRDHAGQPLPSLLGKFLASREVLLVVDNCEHVIAATADLLGTLLPRAPRLRVLATSREAIRTDGESVWTVPPLSIPEAVRLFENRAKAALSSFTICETNQPAVVRICQRLDGMPLAIELAAARVAALSVEQIAARLHDCFSVLGSGRRAALPRHQTLRAAIDWSYDLLTEDERRVLRRLSMFVDSFTLQAAEHVAASTADGPVLDVLGRLVDKSLVFVPERGADGEWRYRLLETVRQYAYEKLLEHEDPAAIAGRHAEYYEQLSEAAAPHINTADRPAWLARLTRDHSDLRAAIERSLRDGRFAHASRLDGALFWFWFHRGLWREGRTFLQAALQHETGPGRTRAGLLLGEGVLAWAEGDQTTAAAHLEECVAVARTAEDATTTAHALHFLAMVRLAAGEAAAGRPLAEEAVRVARTAADPFCLTLALASYGVLLVALGDHDRAREVLEESVERARAAGDVWAVALPLRNLAIIAARHGEYDRARLLLEESLVGLRDLGEKWFLSRSLETLAVVLVCQGEHARASLLFGAAEGLRDAVGAPVLAFYRSDYEDAIARTRDALGAPAFDRSWREGRSLTPEAAVAHALGEAAV